MSFYGKYFTRQVFCTIVRKFLPEVNVLRCGRKGNGQREGMQKGGCSGVIEIGKEQFASTKKREISVLLAAGERASLLTRKEKRY